MTSNSGWRARVGAPVVAARSQAPTGDAPTCGHGTKAIGCSACSGGLTATGSRADSADAVLFVTAQRSPPSFCAAFCARLCSSPRWRTGSVWRRPGGTPPRSLSAGRCTARSTTSAGRSSRMCPRGGAGNLPIVRDTPPLPCRGDATTNHLLLWTGYRQDSTVPRDKVISVTVRITPAETSTGNL